MGALGGRVALVTGASSGIGRAIALALAREAAAVCAVGRDRERLADLVRDAEAGVTPLALDLTDRGTGPLLASRIGAEFGRLHVLVHCAGIAACGRLQDAAPGVLEDQWAVNVQAPYALTRALLPLLVASEGQVVFINSSVTRFPRAETGAYSATKHALLGLADALRAEVNREGVRVLSVFPGRTATPAMAKLFAREAPPYRPQSLLQPEDIASTVIHALTLPRTAEITDVWIRPMQKGAD